MVPVCGAPPSLLGAGEPPFPMQLDMDPSLGAGWARDGARFAGEWAAPDADPLLQLPFPCFPSPVAMGEILVPALPTLAAGSLPSPGVPADPPSPPTGGSQGQRDGNPAHLTQLPCAAIYPPPGTLTSLIFQVLLAASAGCRGGELPGSVGAGPAAPKSPRSRSWGRRGGVWGADPGSPCWGYKGDAQRGSDPALCVPQRRDRRAWWAMGVARTGRGTFGVTVVGATHPPGSSRGGWMGCGRAGFAAGLLSPATAALTTGQTGFSPHSGAFPAVSTAGNWFPPTVQDTEHPRTTGTARPAEAGPAEEVWVQSQVPQVLPNWAVPCPATPSASFFPSVFHPRALKSWLKPASTDHPAFPGMPPAGAGGSRQPEGPVGAGCSAPGCRGVLCVCCQLLLALRGATGNLEPLPPGCLLCPGPCLGVMPAVLGGWWCKIRGSCCSSGHGWSPQHMCAQRCPWVSPRCP